MAPQILSPMTLKQPYAKPINEAFDDAHQAIAAIGKITHSNSNDFILQGKARYGFQGVKVTVTVLEHEGNSLVKIDAVGDDVWETGAKSVVNRFFVALNNTSNPEIPVDRSGVDASKMILQIAIFLLILIPCILLMTSKPAAGVVSANNAILCYDLGTFEDVFRGTMNSPEIMVINKGLSNNPFAETLMPAYDSIIGNAADRFIRQHEASGNLIRVLASTSFRVLGEAKDPVTGQPLCFVELTSGEHASGKGYIHRAALTFNR